MVEEKGEQGYDEEPPLTLLSLLLSPFLMLPGISHGLSNL
jgi:hypothetical protein